jgi:hypothetical protein
MHRARHLALVFGVILALMAPAMACALPDARMSTEEHACCRQMKGHCTGEGMPATHSCCHRNIANRFDAVQPHVAPVPDLAVVAILPTAPRFDFRPLAYVRVNCRAQIPADSPPSAVSILRI